MDLKRQEESYKKVVNDQLKFQYDMKMKALESSDSEESVVSEKRPARLQTNSSVQSGKSSPIKDFSPAKNLAH